MSVSVVEKRVTEVIQEVLGAGVDLAAVDPKTPLKEVSVIDSLSALRVMVALEKEFKLKFESADLEQAFHSIESLARYVERRTGRITVQ